MSNALKRTVLLGASFSLALAALFLCHLLFQGDSEEAPFTGSSAPDQQAAIVPNESYQNPSRRHSIAPFTFAFQLATPFKVAMAGLLVMAVVLAVAACKVVPPIEPDNIVIAEDLENDKETVIVPEQEEQQTLTLKNVFGVLLVVICVACVIIVGIRKWRERDDDHTLIEEGETDDEPGEPIIAGKFILLGEKGVGKTSILTALKGGSCSAAYKETKNFEYNVLETPDNGQMQIWDLGSDSMFEGFVRTFKELNVGLIVFDVTNMQSFERVEHWKGIMDGSVKKILVANKVASEGRVVTPQEGEHAAENMNCQYIEVDASTNYNIEELKALMIDTASNFVTLHD